MGRVGGEPMRDEAPRDKRREMRRTREKWSSGFKRCELAAIGVGI